MRAATGLFLLACLGCQRDLSDEKLIEMSLAAERAAVEARSADHEGPGVANLSSGTARFVPRVLADFSVERALATTAFADRYYREPGNEGFEAVVDHVVTELRAAGFGAEERLELGVIETPLRTPAWTPRNARLVLEGATGEEVLHAFETPEARDRTMLPRNAPSADVAGRVVLALDAVADGTVLLVDAPLTKKLLESARGAGAVLVLSSDLADYNVDPRPRGERHRDAIAYRSVPHPCPLPVAQISPRSAEKLRARAATTGGARVRFQSEVAFAERPLRTVVATVVGAARPDECVALAAHVQEPGACDNASGVGTLLEAARVAAALDRPARSVSFVFGDEMAQSRIFLDHTTRRTIAALAADMTGQSEKETGARPLLERAPDPGALKALPPDRHTAWLRGGETTAEADELDPSGLAVIARAALVDVGTAEPGWKTSEHPYEGGSDHDVFLARGIPAVLFWHFTDFAYHTSLDRLEHVDAAEMRRTGSALVATAFAVADARPSDLERWLLGLQRETALRTRAAREAGAGAIEEAWRTWATGARRWLRALCLGESLPAPKPRNGPR